MRSTRISWQIAAGTTVTIGIDIKQMVKQRLVPDIEAYDATGVDASGINSRLHYCRSVHGAGNVSLSPSSSRQIVHPERCCTRLLMSVI